MSMGVGNRYNNTCVFYNVSSCFILFSYLAYKRFTDIPFHKMA